MPVYSNYHNAEQAGLSALARLPARAKDAVGATGCLILATRDGKCRPVITINPDAAGSQALLSAINLEITSKGFDILFVQGNLT